MQQSNFDVSKEKLMFDMEKYLENVIRNNHLHRYAWNDYMTFISKFLEKKFVINKFFYNLIAHLYYGLRS